MPDLNIPAAPVIEGATHVHSGKVRDLYELSSGDLLMVASDRISIFDFVLDTTIPDKGEIVTRMSLWWFEQLADLVPNHVLSTDVPEQVRGRAVVCERLAMYPVECVARGYLTGSGLLDYQATGGTPEGPRVCGVHLPAGLVDGSRLPEAIFTPATKAAVGDHDENVSYEHVARQIGHADAAELRRLTLEVYTRADEIARGVGLMLADTKFEFGVRHDPDHDFGGGRRAIVLADEVLTPDSSRFWSLEDWRPGQAQPSYDKQIVRNWLLENWDKNSGQRPPALPGEVVERTRTRYLEAYERLTGERF